MHYVFVCYCPQRLLILRIQFTFTLIDFIILYCPICGYSLSLLSSHFLMNLLHYFIHHFLGRKGPCLKSKVHGLWNCCLPQAFFLTFASLTYDKHVNSSWIPSHLVLGGKKIITEKNTFNLISHCSLSAFFPGHKAKQIKIA